LKNPKSSGPEFFRDPRSPQNRIRIIFNRVVDVSNMPLRLDIKRVLSARSDRVKSVDLHPTEPWILVSLYNGHVNIWSYESSTGEIKSPIKTIEVCDLPVRAAVFIARKHWIVTGSDDMKVRVYNYNTMERVYDFEAHSDYLRSIAVHPTLPYIITSSDDMTIKLWDWEKRWENVQVFEGHTHYVMQVAINPKDNNQFASASLDKTIKVWNLGSSVPNYTLEGHDKGVNCVSYYYGGEKPYLISGADDRLVKIWDYQNKSCVQTLEGHNQNISCVMFHPELPIICTGSEDGTVRLWHANTYKQESTLNYGYERVWTLAALPGTNYIALGYDEGTIVIKAGREEPAASMDAAGKIIVARHSEVQQCNLKTLADGDEVTDGERLQLAMKDMGSCEVYPQSISHNPNGRFVVVCGDGEYIIYTAMALRNKAFGSALQFIWNKNDASAYAVRESGTTVKIFKNFKEKATLRPDGGCEAIYAGHLLGVKSSSGLAFYDWETQELVRRIEISPTAVYWSDNDDLVTICTDESFFVLAYKAEKVSESKENPEMVSEDGVEDAFDVAGEIQEVVKTGSWVGDCFIYTNSVNRLNYYVGGEIVTVSHLERPLYLLGYNTEMNRLVLCDKELNIVSYNLNLSILEYQTAVMRQDFETADKVLPSVPKDQRTRVARFLEKQGFKAQAMQVTSDPEHKFELAIALQDIKAAEKLATEIGGEQKWRQLGDLAMHQCDLQLASKCLQNAQDYGGVLLLASATGDAQALESLASGSGSGDKYNVSFLSYFMMGKLEECLDLLVKSDRLPEAAMFARTYLPSKVSEVLPAWKAELGKTSTKAAERLADPATYENLFPKHAESLDVEKFVAKERQHLKPATSFSSATPSHERDLFEEYQQLMRDGGGSMDVDEPKIHPSTTAASNSGAAAAAAPPAAAPSKTTDSLEDLDKAIEDIDINDVNASDLDDDDLLADDDDGADLLSD